MITIEEQIISAQSGNASDFEALLEHAVSLAMPFLKNHSIPDHDCDDIVQEILIGVHRSLRTYQKKSPGKAWLFSIIRYKLADFFRRKYRHSAKDLNEELDLFFYDIDLEQELIRNELKEQLYQALSKLNKTQESVIRLLKFEGHAIKDVAQRLNLSEANVKVIASRGYKKLALILGKNPLYLECIFILMVLDAIKSKI